MVRKSIWILVHIKTFQYTPSPVSIERNLHSPETSTVAIHTVSNDIIKENVELKRFIEIMKENEHLKYENEELRRKQNKT